MKDFSEIINSNEQLEEKKVQVVSNNTFKVWQDRAITILSPLLLSMVTGPFTTASVLLQTTSKGLAGTGIDTKIKAQPSLQRHISNGLFGDNRIYEPPTLNGYKDTLNKLGREGIRGLYKGNFTGILLASSNAWLRGNLYKETGEKGWLNQGLFATNLITITTCTIADLITLPLMTAQSRLILQNSASSFRTYKSFLSVFRKTSPTLLFSGASLIFCKNLFFDLSWMKLMPESPAYSFVFSTIFSHLLTYPFATIMRQMQVSDSGAAMMHNRKQTIRQCTTRLWNEGKLSSFYRGFLAYSIVHLFIGALMVQANLRSGYFYQEE